MRLDGRSSSGALPRLELGIGDAGGVRGGGVGGVLDATGPAEAKSGDFDAQPLTAPPAPPSVLPTALPTVPTLGPMKQQQAHSKMQPLTHAAMIQ